jgi:hypothetical protein
MWFSFDRGILPAVSALKINLPESCHDNSVKINAGRLSADI